jgi:hypothetical protein
MGENFEGVTERVNDVYKDIESKNKSSVSQVYAGQSSTSSVKRGLISTSSMNAKKMVPYSNKTSIRLSPIGSTHSP